MLPSPSSAAALAVSNNRACFPFACASGLPALCVCCGCACAPPADDAEKDAAEDGAEDEDEDEEEADEDGGGWW